MQNLRDKDAFYSIIKAFIPEEKNDKDLQIIAILLSLCPSPTTNLEETFSSRDFCENKGGKFALLVMFSFGGQGDLLAENRKRKMAVFQ